MQSLGCLAINIMYRKYIDRTQSSSYSLARSASPTQLPSLYSRRTEDFALSVKKHINRAQQNNPQKEQTQSIRYYLDRELSQNQKLSESDLSTYLTARRRSLVSSSRNQQSKLSMFPELKERPECEVYQERVENNIKKYGRGMLRHRHSNVLSVSAKQGDLLELHYRLKKQRELSMLRKESRDSNAKFKQLLARYESL